MLKVHGSVFRASAGTIHCDHSNNPIVATTLSGQITSTQFGLVDSLLNASMYKTSSRYGADPARLVLPLPFLRGIICYSHPVCFLPAFKHPSESILI